MKSRRFAPPLWATLLAVAGCAAALSLGAWQLGRADAKQQLLSDYLQATTQAPLPLDPAQAGTAQPHAASVRGVYLGDRQLLLDNQARREEPGYHVWTPLRLEGGGLVLVSRGWIKQFARRDQPVPLAAPSGQVEVRGYWRELPRPGLRLPPPPCRKAESFPQFVVYPRAAELACVLGEPVADGLLLLHPQESGGYVREWTFSDAVPPERHIGYAVQWFAIALAIFILYLKLNLKTHD